MVGLMYDFSGRVVGGSLQGCIIIVEQGRAGVCAAVVYDGYEKGKLCLLPKDGIEALFQVWGGIVYGYDDVKVVVGFYAVVAQTGLPLVGLDGGKQGFGLLCC